MKKVTNDFILDQLKAYQKYVLSNSTDPGKGNYVVLSGNSIFALVTIETVKPIIDERRHLERYYKSAFEKRNEEFRMLIGLPSYDYLNFLYPNSLGYFLSNKLQSTHAVKIVNELVKVFGELDISNSIIEYFVVSTLNIMFSTDLRLIYSLNSAELIALINESRIISTTSFGDYKPKYTPFEMCVRTSFFNLTNAQKKVALYSQVISELEKALKSKSRFNVADIRAGLVMHSGYILFPELINRCLNSINLSILRLDYKCKLIQAIKNTGDEEHRKLVVELFNSLDINKFIDSTREYNKAKVERKIDEVTAKAAAKPVKKRSSVTK